MNKSTAIKLSNIRLDGNTQTRAAINDERVAEYSELMIAGKRFPPIVLFFDGVTYWLADGFHRHHASKRGGFVDIESDVRTGTRQDAVRYALGANVEHGLHRSNADKRRCVEIALAEFSDSSNSLIADMCGVSHPFVGKVRPEVVTVTTSEAETTRIGRDGVRQPATKPKRKEAETTPPATAHKEFIAPPEPPEPPEPQTPITIKSSNGMQFAVMAISQLKRILPGDTERIAALQKVQEYITKQLQ